MRTESVIKMNVQVMACSACGAQANASCNCGKPYVLAKQRAAWALAANPRKSNVAIAEEIGVGETTVRRAREGSPHGEPEREGKDGKLYRLPVREQEQSIEDFEAEIEPGNKRSAFLLRADQARQFCRLFRENHQRSF